MLLVVAIMAVVVVVVVLVVVVWSVAAVFICCRCREIGVSAVAVSFCWLYFVALPACFLIFFDIVQQPFSLSAGCDYGGPAATAVFFESFPRSPDDRTHRCRRFDVDVRDAGYDDCAGDHVGKHAWALEARGGRPEYESGKQARRTPESKDHSTSFVKGGAVELAGAAADGQGRSHFPLLEGQRQVAHIPESRLRF